MGANHTHRWTASSQKAFLQPPAHTLSIGVLNDTIWEVMVKWGGSSGQARCGVEMKGGVYRHHHTGPCVFWVVFWKTWIHVQVSTVTMGDVWRREPTHRPSAVETMCLGASWWDQKLRYRARSRSQESASEHYGRGFWGGVEMRLAVAFNCSAE